MIHLTEEDFKKIENDKMRFIQLRHISDKRVNGIFEYTTKRGKKVHINLYANVKTTGIGLSIYSNQNLTQEIIINGSLIAHDLRQILESKPEYRVKKLTGSFAVSMEYMIEEDVESYIEKKKKRRQAGMKKAEVTAMREHLRSFYDNAKTLVLPRREEQSYFESSVLLVSGREGRYLVDMLVDMGIASYTKWSKQYNLKFHYKDFLSHSKSLDSHFQKELERLGFSCYIHTWYD